MIEFYSELYSFLDDKHIKYDVDGQIIRFIDSDYSLFLVLDDKINSVNLFTKQRNHEVKKHNKLLVFIWFDLWQHKKEVLLSKITHLCGKSIKIHARKTKVNLVNKEDTELFLIKNHLNKPVVGYKRLGLYLNDDLIALASFAKRRKFRDDSYSAELLQFATKNGTHINGGLSKLIKHFKLSHQIDSLMTYIDLDWSNGNKFSRIGFENTDIKPAVYFTNNLRTKLRDTTNSSSGIFNLGNIKAIQKFKIC